MGSLAAKDPPAPSNNEVIQALTALNFKPENITTSTVTLTWKSPVGKLSSEVKEYKVLYKAGTTENFVMTMSSDPMYTLTGLSPGTKYEVWVVPLTTKGLMGVESEHQTFTTSGHIEEESEDQTFTTSPSPDTSSSSMSTILMSSVM